MTWARAVNEAVAFALEIGALVALAYWGYTAHDDTPTRLAFTIGTPALAAFAWGLLAAPKATVRLPIIGQLAVKALVFGAAVAALLDTGHRTLATVYAALVIVNTTILTLYRQRDPGPGD